ncbi:protein-tyrosine kinase [Lachnospira eligens]|jgi:capsular polysaccharide biosynthesis protein|nr:protein-tyrosine kinase [Lachnospira eligens]HBA10073.1 protein-tyrosine kinase [Eubacterium sp.]
MMETNKSTDEIEINLGEIFALLLHKVWIIILAAVVCGAVGFLYSYFLITPQYQSTTKVYILNKQNSTSVTYSDVQLSTTLSKDYEQLVTSRYVIEGVIKQLNLDETYESLVGKVSATNTDDTRIIAITVINPDPQQAQKVANAVRDLAAQHITQVMDIEAVNVVDSANLPTSPVSPSVPKWTLIGAAIGIIIAVAVVVIQHLLDDSIKSSEDIEKYLGISTLALIPMNQAEEETASRRRSPRKDKEKVVLGTDDEKARSFKSSDINKNTNNKNSKRNADGIEFMED